MARTPVVMFSAAMPNAGFDRAAFADAIRRRIERLDRHADQVLESPSSVDGRAAFVNRLDAESFVEWLLGRLGQTGGPIGAASFHMCSHALGEEATEPCYDVATEYYERTG